MKIPSQLSKGLDEDKIKRLESDLKSSVLAEQLRKTLEQRIRSIEYAEEALTEPNLPQLASELGERRGYRAILELLTRS